jgi:hypothetical protein
MSERYCEKCDKSVDGNFCSECGKQTLERRPAVPAAQGHAGPQKIMAGGDLTHNVSHTNTTTVYNQDETKQVQTCAVSGRQAEITRGHMCPSCGLWVHGDCFDHDTKLCTNCNSKKAKGAQQTFKDKVSEFLSDDQISQDEIQFLRDFGGRLNVTVAEQDNIIATIKKERVQEASVPLSRIEKSKYDTAIKVLLDDNYEDVARVGGLAAMRTLEAIYERHPNNMEVAGSLMLAYMIAPMTGGEDLNQAESRWAEKVQQLVRISPAFAHDTEGKFFYMSMAAGGLLLVDRMARHIRQHALAKMNQEQWEAFPGVQLIEAMKLHADEYRLMDQLNIEACSELEKAFSDSDEWVCVELMLMFEEYFANGHDPAIKSEILQIIPDTSGEISGDIGAVLEIVREKLLQDENFALLEKEKRVGLSGYGQMIYYSLFCSFKDLAEDIQAQMGQAESHASGERGDAVEGKAEVERDAVEEQLEEEEIVLDLAIAQSFLKTPDKYDLSRVTSITDEAAEALSIARGEINLSGLTKLSDAAARSLANMSEYSDLYLSGLTTLSTVAAHELAGHKGNILCLRGLTELSDGAARALASNQKEPDYLVLNDYMEHRIDTIKNSPASDSPPPLPDDGPPPLPGSAPTAVSPVPSEADALHIEELQQRYHDAHQALAGVDGFYVSGDIPKKKITGAIKGYLPPEQAGEIYFLYDDTVFGGAKEGLCFTGGAIYFKEISEATRLVQLEDVERFSMRHGTMSDKLSAHLRDGTVAEYSFTSNEEKANAMEQVLQAALDVVKAANV